MFDLLKKTLEAAESKRLGLSCGMKALFIGEYNGFQFHIKADFYEGNTTVTWCQSQSEMKLEATLVQYATTFRENDDNLNTVTPAIM